MTIQKLMEKKDLSKYRLSKNSGIPYTTIQDICSGKAKLEKCTAETVYRLAKELDVSMEVLLQPCFTPRIDFELFKSNVCHRVKEMGDVDYIIDALESDKIREYYDRQWYPESFYLLAMLDYLSRENDVPQCTAYQDIRRGKLRNPLFPASILATAAVLDDEKVKETALAEAIPEFKRFNIIESEVRNVI